MQSTAPAIPPPIAPRYRTRLCCSAPLTALAVPRLAPLPAPQEQADDTSAPKGAEFKHTRRQLSQVLTVLREKQIADGIGRKESRKLEKEAAIGVGFGRL